MKKGISVLLTLSLIIASLNIVSCENNVTRDEGYEFTDDLGRKVFVKEGARACALLGSFADMWMLAGGEIVASADDAWEDFCLPLSESVLNLGSTHAPSKESVLLSAPDIVLASSKLSRHLEMREALEGAGISVAYFDVGDFNDFVRVMKIFTEITGCREAYDTYCEKQSESIEASLSSGRVRDGITVLTLRASALYVRAKNSDGTMLGGMLRDFGCVNLADGDDTPLENLSIESIVLMNPEKIFFVESGASSEEVRTAVEKMFEENPLWYTLDAVKNGEVYFMDKRLYNLKPNARFAEAYERLEEILSEK